MRKSGYSARKSDLLPISARSAYGNRAEYIDISRDKEKFDEMLTISGGKALVPVIVEGDKITIGFNGI